MSDTLLEGLRRIAKPRGEFSRSSQRYATSEHALRAVKSLARKTIAAYEREKKK